MFFLVITCLFLLVAGQGGDWDDFFRPAALSSSYSEGIFNPPWLFPMLLPLAWLPSRVGAAVLAALTLVVLIEYVKGDWCKALALVLSAPALAVLHFGQIDVIPLVALMMPTWCSLPLLAVKPQGVFLAALRRLTPASITVFLVILSLSFLVWGLWPLDILDIAGTPDGLHNRSIFPWSVGITFGVLAYLRTHPDTKHADGLLCLASLAASPYWAIHSLLPMTALFIGGTKSRAGCLAICAATWVYTLLTRSPQSIWLMV